MMADMSSREGGDLPDLKGIPALAGIRQEDT